MAGSLASSTPASPYDREGRSAGRAPSSGPAHRPAGRARGRLRGDRPGGRSCTRRAMGPRRPGPAGPAPASRRRGARRRCRRPSCRACRIPPPATTDARPGRCHGSASRPRTGCSRARRSPAGPRWRPGSCDSCHIPLADAPSLQNASTTSEPPRCWMASAAPVAMPRPPATTPLAPRLRIVPTRDVHRTAPAMAVAGLLAEQLGHHPARVMTLRDGMAVAAVGADDVVVRLDGRDRADGDPLLAEIRVEIPADVPEAVLLDRSLFESSDRQRRLVHRLEQVWVRSRSCSRCLRWSARVSVGNSRPVFMMTRLSDLSSNVWYSVGYAAVSHRHVNRMLVQGDGRASADAPSRSASGDHRPGQGAGQRPRPGPGRRPSASPTRPSAATSPAWRSWAWSGAPMAARSPCVRAMRQTRRSGSASMPTRSWPSVDGPRSSSPTELDHPRLRHDDALSRPRAPWQAGSGRGHDGRHERDRTGRQTWDDGDHDRRRDPAVHVRRQRPARRGDPPRSPRRPGLPGDPQRLGRGRPDLPAIRRGRREAGDDRGRLTR